MRTNVEFVATKKGMAAALALAAYNKELSAYFLFDRLTAGSRHAAGPRAGGRRAARRNHARKNCCARCIGFCMVDDRADWRATALRLIEIFMDGFLRDGRK